MERRVQFTNSIWTLRMARSADERHPDSHCHYDGIYYARRFQGVCIHDAYGGAAGHPLRCGTICGHLL